MSGCRVADVPSTGFVDIAGYTALTDTHGEHAAADLWEDFARMLRSAFASRGHVQEIAGDNA